jgi:hypothetical protein
MRTLLFPGLAVVLVLCAGCGSNNRPAPPAGVVYQGKHVSEWGDDLKSPDRQTRLEAAKVLVKVGNEGSSTNDAIPGLQIALKDEDPAVRGWAAVAMMHASHGTPFPIGPLVVPKLKEAAESTDEELRTAASQLLKKMEDTPAGPRGRPGRPGAQPEEGKEPSEEKKAPNDEAPKEKKP